MHDRKLGLRPPAPPGSSPMVARSAKRGSPSLLGDSHLSGDAPQDDLASEVDPLSRQRVDNVVPRPRLDRIERFRRFGTTSAGNHWNDREVGV